MINNIELIIHSAIKIKNNDDIIYFDPFKLEDKVKNIEQADYIFITHPHFDHYSEYDIKLIKKDNTKIVVPSDLESNVLSLGFNKEDILVVKPNNEYSIDNYHFETIRAYNENKDFHKKENDWVGYVIEINNERIYIAGDTDNTIDSRNVKCDIALVPIGGIYTCDYKEAVELVKSINPSYAVPTHYNSIVGSRHDGYRFKEELDGIVKVELMLKK